MVKKYFIDPESVAFKRGFSGFFHNSKWNLYSGRTEYGNYINYKAGIEQAERESKALGKKQVWNHFRFNLCLSLIGKSKNEIIKISEQLDDSIYNHELKAILIQLHSTSFSFNAFVRIFFNDNKICPYSVIGHYSDNIYWHDGFQAAELAVRLHGRETVINHSEMI